MPYSARSCLPAREGSDVVTYPTALDPASLLRSASALPRVPRLWILPPCLRGLRRCHVSHGSGSCLPAREGSGAATCPTALITAYLFGRALTLPCVPQIQILPPAQEGSSAVTCPTASSLTSLLRRALTLPHVFAALCGPQTSIIMKGLDGLPMRLDSCVSKACPHVTEMPDI
jgi:hypothetical protein